MTVTIDGTSGVTTPGVVNTAAQTIATTLAVTGVTTIAAGTAAAPALVGATGGATTGVWFPAASTVAFANAGVESARIDSSGNLLVGTTTSIGTSPARIEIKGSSGGGRPINTSVDIGSSANHISFNNTNGQVGSISSSGSTTAYNTSSDYRLKNTIAPMTGALDKVALLKPCTYKWNVDGSDGQGFIAHELAEVEPGCVTGEKDAVDAGGNPQYQGIDTSFLVATLTAAIQEQQTLITALTARITALETAA
jgi:hypothetical protein